MHSKYLNIEIILPNYLPVWLTPEQHMGSLHKDFSQYIGKFFGDMQQFERHFPFYKSTVYNTYNILNTC